MTITEKLQNGWYIGMPSGQYNRMILHSNEELEVDQQISKQEPKDIDTIKTLCQITSELFGEGEEYPEVFKQKAIDVTVGYITIEEAKFELNID